MKTFMCHCLEHLVEVLRAVVGVVYLHAGHYKSAHKNFKRAYKRTSTLNGSATKETLNALQLQSTHITISASSEIKCVARPSWVISICKGTICISN